MNQDLDEAEKWGLFLNGGAFAFMAPRLQVFH
jgi:hypothetical protein